MKIATTLGSILLAATAILGAQRAQIPTGGELPDGRKRDRTPEKITEVVRRVQGNVYVVAGIGSNISVLAGDDGVFIVDTQYQEFTAKIMDAIRMISDRPVRFVVNTHSHVDHTGGNANFAQMGALIFAPENLRRELMRPAGQNAQPAPAAALPVVTYSAPLTLHVNGEEVVLIPSPKPSHTTGDTFVYFKGSDVMATGDVYNANYPAVNVGDAQGVLDAWKAILDMIGPNTKIVPGHGQLQTRADLVELRDAMITINGRIRDMIAKGMTYEQVSAARPTREFDARFSVEQGGRNEVRTTEQWLRAYYDTLARETRQP